MALLPAPIGLTELAELAGLAEFAESAELTGTLEVGEARWAGSQTQRGCDRTKLPNAARWRPR